jgi:predicted metal-dependent hydrolase
MDKQKLHVQLAELDAELQQIESVDDNEREMLQKLAREIHEILEREGDHAQQYSGLGERLRESIAQLEASHPRITLLMRQLIDQLSPLGI